MQTLNNMYKITLINAKRWGVIFPHHKLEEAQREAMIREPAFVEPNQEDPRFEKEFAFSIQPHKDLKRLRQLSSKHQMIGLI